MLSPVGDDYLEITIMEIDFSCLDCKHHEHSYNAPSMGEGEPELEFYCNHPEVSELEVDDESQLFKIAHNCSYFEPSELLNPELDDTHEPTKLCFQCKWVFANLPAELLEQENFDDSEFEWRCEHPECGQENSGIPISPEDLAPDPNCKECYGHGINYAGSEGYFFCQCFPDETDHLHVAEYLASHCSKYITEK